MQVKRLDSWLLLTWRKGLLIPAAWVICVVLHNAIYAAFHSFFEPGGDEPVFFFLAVVAIPLYAVACVLYSLTRLMMRFLGTSRSS